MMFLRLSYETCFVHLTSDKALSVNQAGLDGTGLR